MPTAREYKILLKIPASGEWEATMNFHQRKLLLAATGAGAVVIAAATPLLAQTGSPGARNAPIPDFTSVFWAHPSLGFENPVSGPGPVRNLSRTPAGASNFNKLVGDYTNPILNRRATEVIKARGEISLSGKAYPDPDNQCMLNPVPYIFWNFEIQILQQPHQITIIYPHDMDRRTIRMNQQHPAKVTPTIHGDSVGHYEGDTLVVDTVGVKLRPYAMADRLGTPYTEALHVVERYRLLDFQVAKEAQERGQKEWPRVGGAAATDSNTKTKGMQLEFTVDDAGVFTMPWKATITYLPATHDDWQERVCAENVQQYYVGGSFYSDKDATIPTAKTPDF
jgi:hypothetical protein